MSHRHGHTQKSPDSARLSSRTMLAARPAEEGMTFEHLVCADRLAALGTLSAGVAHEINNPLTYVLVNLEHVVRQLRAHVASGEPLGLEEIDAQISALGQALEGATRVRGIVRDLMTFASGHIEARSLVDVRRVLDASIQMTAYELRHRARVERRMRDVPPVVANEAQLGQVFLNLLVNAVRAIPEGDMANNAITVQTELLANGRVVVLVSDTGEGIAAEDLPRIFDPFFTTRTNTESSGLGLSIAHGIVASLAGTLTVSSALGKGTEFRVELPAAPGYEATSRGTTGFTPVRPSSLRVLVVDEDPCVAEAIAMSLSDEHDAQVTNNATDVLARIERGDDYDVILCDLMMPNVTGMDLYREVLRIAPQIASRIVFMTGGVYTANARAFVEGVPNRCIEKPPDMAKLRELVRRRGK
jgi:signal transduction histidine kinase/CheY-like chemotaxis protein